MNRLPGYTYRILRTLLLAMFLGVVLCPLPVAAQGSKQENRKPWESDYFVYRLPAVEKGDTLLYGIFRIADRERLNALIESEVQAMVDLPESEEEQMQLALQLARHQQQAGNKGEQPPATDFSASSLQKKKADIEVQRKKALKQLDALPQSADKQKMVKEVNAAFDKMLADLPGVYSEGQETAAGIESKTPPVSDKPLPTLTASQKYAVKKKIAAMAMGGKLYNYSKVRNFRYGRAAVAIQVNGEERWGFIDETGRRVVPCKYSNVFDFKNRRYRSGGVFDPQSDMDDRMWTTVWEPGKGMGMVDADGREVIPCRYRSDKFGYIYIEFLKTPWGEYAPVQDRETGKFGIIDRSGNYTLAPSYTEKIIFYTDLKRFTTTVDGERIYFDQRGNRMSRQ